MLLISYYFLNNVLCIALNATVQKIIVFINYISVDDPVTFFRNLCPKCKYASTYERASILDFMSMLTTSALHFLHCCPEHGSPVECLGGRRLSVRWTCHADGAVKECHVFMIFVTDYR